CDLDVRGSGVEEVAERERNTGRLKCAHVGPHRLPHSGLGAEVTDDVDAEAGRAGRAFARPAAPAAVRPRPERRVETELVAPRRLRPVEEAFAVGTEEIRELLPHVGT